MNKFLHIAILLFVSLASTFLFAADKWQFFYGESCVIELLIMFLGSVVACVLGCYKRPFATRLQFFQFLGLILLNFIIVIPPIVNHTRPFINIGIFQVLHFILLLASSFSQKKRFRFTVLSGFMIYCSAIAYRLNTIGYFFHDGEGLGVGNLEMFVSVVVLFCVTSIIICIKTFEE